MEESQLDMIKKGLDYWNNNRLRPQQKVGSWSDHLALDLSNLDLSDMDLSNFDFNNTNLKGTNLENADLSNADLSNSRSDEATNLKGTSLENANLRKAKFYGVDFTNASLRNADLRGSKLNQNIMDGVDLTNIKADLTTYIGQIGSCKGCIIKRYTLDSLDNADPNRGFKSSNKKDMIILDDLGTLKLSFSGFWKMVHIVALALFVFPYIFFLFKCWSIANGVMLFNYEPSPNNTSTIGGELWEYFYTSGELNGEWSYWVIISFALILYNLSRTILLWKTIKLEHKQIVTGLPVYFEMTRSWKVIYYITNYGMYLNIILAIIHTIKFLMIRMP